MHIIMQVEQKYAIFLGLPFKLCGSLFCITVTSLGGI